MKKVISLAVLTAVLTGCMDLNPNGSSTSYNADGFGEETLVTGASQPSLGDAYLLTAAPKYYIGTAYKVDDVQYIPVEDMTYNQTGIAGIIPTELNGTKTSNGEVFDVNQMVATSKTLPLPTIGLNGQAKVQIQVLPEQTMIVKNATLGTVPVVEAPVAKPVPVAAETVTVASVEAPAPVAQPAPVVAGDYAVQIAAFYAQDSADALVQRMKTYGDAVVVNEGDMFKVRIINLDAAKARSVIDNLRANEGMAPGLLKDGRWVNPDSI